MISICIKSINKSKLNILDKQLEKLPIPHIYYSQKKFKNYYNLIIHYTGKSSAKFYDGISNIVTNYIINNLEEKIIRKQIMYEYFYFNTSERELIIRSAIEKLQTPFYSHEKNFILKEACDDYIYNNKSIYLEGFINFRIYKYRKLITTILEEIINDYVIQKEYAEYVNLLHEYIQIQPSQSNIVHLIYNSNTKLLLDERGNVISNIDNSQVYLSDISFSSNDFILNTLLTSLPKNLYIHLNTEEDNFIKFLKLIFNGRYSICTQCKICSNYFSVNSSRLPRQQ